MYSGARNAAPSKEEAARASEEYLLGKRAVGAPAGASASGKATVAAQASDFDIIKVTTARMESITAGGVARGGTGGAVGAATGRSRVIAPQVQAAAIAREDPAAAFLKQNALAPAALDQRISADPQLIDRIKARLIAELGLPVGGGGGGGAATSAQPVAAAEKDAAPHRTHETTKDAAPHRTHETTEDVSEQQRRHHRRKRHHRRSDSVPLDGGNGGGAEVSHQRDSQRAFHRPRDDDDNDHSRHRRRDHDHSRRHRRDRGRDHNCDHERERCEGHVKTSHISRSGSDSSRSRSRERARLSSRHEHDTTEHETNGGGGSSAIDLNHSRPSYGLKVMRAAPPDTVNTAPAVGPPNLLGPSEDDIMIRRAQLSARGIAYPGKEQAPRLPPPTGPSRPRQDRESILADMMSAGASRQRDLTAALATGPLCDDPTASSTSAPPPNLITTTATAIIAAKITSLGHLR